MSSQLLTLLHRANQIATERFSQLAGAPLTTRQVQLLSAIDGSKSPSQTMLVNLTGVDRSTVADMVRRLQRQKLVERRRSKRDSRAYVVNLTQRGKQALAENMPLLAATEKRLLAGLQTQERIELIHLLSKLVESNESAP